MKPRILVTPRSATRSGHPSLSLLEEQGYEVVFCQAGMLPKEDEIIALLPGCVGYLAGVETISARVLASAPELKAISRNGTGADAIDAAAADLLGIRILRAAGANARGVAELTMALALALSRSLFPTDRCMKQALWQRHEAMELEGKTLGLVGCGRIGRLVTGFATAFGMRVLGYDLYPTWPEAPSSFEFTDLDTVLISSDVVSLHCPPPPGGGALLDAARLATLKEGVMIINTARGALIDDQAMIRALDSGHVRGLGLDVFEQEPPADWTLARHPGVISSPHIGGFTPESIDRAMFGAVENLLNALAAEPSAQGVS